ncbi:MAG: hypothetical protein CMP76_03295 [Flavobacterium sp.]|uniref:hypothetical protein n=1 Tax=unclassified Flavobacterium TaxID=196869 RepID=UPI000C51037D|nr:MULTISPECIES: hypothetical protein [unclassified Flavobacterium]MBF02302.1 hypothetical protein [Flavobacterium sp.]MCO6161580.1 hypothetical protein [Flavobacterium sp. NRK F7]|tara:strand:- start:1162 stop:1605 length:444 start_codon:yes stop_codon:yes gene_type:complete
MKNSIEIKNGLLIFLGIGLFFLTMDMVGLADKNYLRILNALIVLYGINRTIQYNFHHGKSDYLENLISGFKTGIIGVFLGIVGLIIFVYLKGGEAYLSKLSDTFFFVGKTNIIKYVSVLLFEGIASSLIGSFALMQYWKDVVVNSKY